MYATYWLFLFSKSHYFCIVRQQLESQLMQLHLRSLEHGMHNFKLDPETHCMQVGTTFFFLCVFHPVSQFFLSGLVIGCSFLLFSYLEQESEMLTSELLAIEQGIREQIRMVSL